MATHHDTQSDRTARTTISLSVDGNGGQGTVQRDARAAHQSALVPIEPPRTASTEKSFSIWQKQLNDPTATSYVAGPTEPKQSVQRSESEPYRFKQLPGGYNHRVPRDFSRSSAESIRWS